MLSATVVMAFLGLLLAALLYPFETTVVPEWKVQVVDESGAPLAALRVSELWQHHSIESARHEQTLTTDSDGYATFPRRTINASLLARISGAIRAGLNIHGDWGPHVSLIVLGRYSTVTSNDYSVNQLPSTIVERRLPP